jgi:hypothetical protein
VRWRGRGRIGKGEAIFRCCHARGDLFETPRYRCWDWLRRSRFPLLEVEFAECRSPGLRGARERGIIGWKSSSAADQAIRIYWYHRAAKGIRTPKTSTWPSRKVVDGRYSASPAYAFFMACAKRKIGESPRARQNCLGLPGRGSWRLAEYLRSGTEKRLRINGHAKTF